MFFRFPIFLFSIFYFLFLFSSYCIATSGLQISGTADLVGSLEVKENRDPNKNRIDAREVEIMLYSPIDHLFDGTVSIAAHQENGTALFHIHEAYIGSSKLIPRSRFRIGQFFLGFGRLNRFHRHDWPFTSTPTVISEFFQHAEGLLDTGFEYSYLFPLPFYLDLTVGITNGWIFGHAHNIGNKPLVPTHYARLATFLSQPESGGSEIGLNYVGRKDHQAIHDSFIGLDTTTKWKEGKFTRFLLQNEIWLSLKSPNTDAIETEKTLGFYLYPQYSFSEQWSLGIRFDGLTILNKKDGLLRDESNFDYTVVPTVTYKSSEFTTIRANFNYRSLDRAGGTDRVDKYFELQAVFLLGTHPAHDF